MGQIDRFDLQSYIDNYKTSIFIETGTGKGGSLQHALKFSFDELYTIEVITEIYLDCVEKFKLYENCHLINDNSKNGLEFILKNVGPSNNIIYWLDAHFPGADSGLSGYGSVEDKNMRIPLENELRSITSIRDSKNDVFIIDDLRIYEDGPYNSGNWVDRNKFGGDGIDFIYELFYETHIINKDYRDEGYIILTPKNF